MVKFLRRLTNTLLVISGVAAAIGLLYTLKPEYFLFIFETLEMTEAQVGAASAILSGIAIFGSLSKYFKKIIETNQIFYEDDMTRRLKEQEEKHEAALEAIRDTKIQELEIYSTKVNELINTSNELKELNTLILDVMKINADRNISSNLVTTKDKARYANFLEKAEQYSPQATENVFTEIIEEIERPVIIEVEKPKRKRSSTRDSNNYGEKYRKRLEQGRGE